MKVLINYYTKRNQYGDFMAGQVFFDSLVTNGEHKKIPSSLKVNLSKSGNPDCDTSIKFLQSHNAHAGTFTDPEMMHVYTERVRQDITQVVREYNMEQEEYNATPEKLDYSIIEENEDLHPPPAPAYVLPEGVLLIDMEHLQEMNDMLIDMLDEDGNEIDG